MKWTRRNRVRCALRTERVGRRSLYSADPVVIEWLARRGAEARYQVSIDQAWTQHACLRTIPLPTLYRSAGSVKAGGGHFTHFGIFGKILV